jgi:NAD(P)-dependent dehydrogenase (short-subunit alcohol dehydrogenase family)
MNPPADSLGGKVALVTGAGSGIGAATARLFAACGARVGLVDRAAEGLAATAAAIAGSRGEALQFVADVTDAAQLAAAVARIESAWGRLDIVFANAGINGFWGPLDQVTPEDWDETLGVNLKGTFLTVRACAPLLERSGGGSIIITSSGLGTHMFSNTGASAYATSKAGQVAFGRMVALELARHRIRVNIICPGAIKTGMKVSTRGSNLRALRLPVDYPQGIVPLTGGEPGSAEQVARLVWFLASDLSDHITGAEITIDGGQSLMVG